MILSDFKDLPPTSRGALTGAVFCTLTLPITNYRFRKSVNLPIELSSLYQAYLPTVLRDIVYGIVRTKVDGLLRAKYPEFVKTEAGKFMVVALQVAAACIISAPFNEIRAYTLQPANKKKTVKEFFQPEKFVRSTSIGALIMSIALAVGAIATQPVKNAVDSTRSWMKANQIESIFLMFVVHQYLAQQRSSA